MQHNIWGIMDRFCFAWIISYIIVLTYYSSAAIKVVTNTKHNIRCRCHFVNIINFSFTDRGIYLKIWLIIDSIQILCYVHKWYVSIVHANLILVDKFSCKTLCNVHRAAQCAEVIGNIERSRSACFKSYWLLIVHKWYLSSISI